MHRERSGAGQHITETMTSHLGRNLNTIHREPPPPSPKPLRELENNLLIMATYSQEIPTTKKNKRKALRIITKKKSKVQRRQERRTNMQPCPNLPPQNEKWSQAFEELQSKFMRMEEIW